MIAGPDAAVLPAGSLPVVRPVVLIGLMGAGKSSIGRRLAGLLDVPFADADHTIVGAVGLSVAEIFERFGESAFRMIERQVITGLIDDAPRVLATGGGAFMNAEIRRSIRRHATSVWLRADLDLLVRRTAGRSGRPLLATGDARATLARLMAERYPVYGEADVIVDTRDDPADMTAARVRDAIVGHWLASAGGDKGI